MTRTRKRPSSDSRDQKAGGFSPFVLAVLAVLLVSIAMLVAMRMDKSADSLAFYRGPFLEVHGVQYEDAGSYEELHDNELLGTYPNEFRLGLNGGNANPEGEVIGDTLTYRLMGHNDAERPYATYFRSQATIILTGTRGSSVEYRIEPAVPEEKGAWVASVTAPKDRNLENPVGTWRLMVSSSSGKWKHTTWLTIRGDGTGEFGSLDKDFEAATAAELAKATHPCTVTCEKTPWGARAIATYDGGTYVMTVAERSMDDVLAASV